MRFTLHIAPRDSAVNSFAPGGRPGRAEETEEAGETAAEMAPEAEMGAAAEMEAQGHRIEITNPMPHDMTVYVQGADGETELGTVPANGSATFDPGMTESTEVTLRAVDASGRSDA